MRRAFIALITVAVAVSTAWAGSPAPGIAKDLDLYIRARLAESSGDYREALSLYAKALAADPSSGEIRIGFAALLEDLRLYGKALAVIGPVQDLDWYGRRVKAIALAATADGKRDKLREAEKALRKVLAERTEDPSVQMTLVQVLQREGRLEEAERLLEDLRARHPTNLRLMMMQADLLRSLGRLDEAAKVLEDCVRAGPPGSGCRDQLVDVLVAAGRKAEAADVMVSGLAPDDLDGMMRAAALYVEAGRPRQALPIVKRVLDKDPDSPRAQRFEAIVLSALGRYREAAAVLARLYRKHEDDTDLALELAWAEARGGRVPAARKLVTNLWLDLKKNPSSVAAVRTCLTGARIELLAGRTDAAREWLGRIQKPAKGGRQLVRIMAETYRRAKSWRRGVGAMLRLQPRLEGDARDEARAFEAEFRFRLNDPTGLRVLRPLLRSSSVEKVRLALDVLAAVDRWQDVAREAAAALKRFPGDHDLMFSRAAALERLGRRDEAAELFQAILKADPDDATTANYLGYMWADAGEHLDRALKLISHAVELDPENGAYLDSLGWVYFRLGKLDEAEHWLRRAATRLPQDGTVLAHLGEVLAARGKAEQARDLLERALARGCDDAAHVRSVLGGLKKGP